MINLFNPHYFFLNNTMSTPDTLAHCYKQNIIRPHQYSGLKRCSRGVYVKSCGSWKRLLNLALCRYRQCVVSSLERPGVVQRCYHGWWLWSRHFCFVHELNIAHFTLQCAAVQCGERSHSTLQEHRVHSIISTSAVVQWVHAVTLFCWLCNICDLIISELKL